MLAWFDGRRWEFDAAGRPVRTWAGPGTAVRFGTTRTAGWSSWSTSTVGSVGRGVGPRFGHGPGRRGVRLGRAARRLPLRPAARWSQADGPAGARRYELDEAGRVVVGDRRRRRRRAGQHLRRAGPGADPALAVRAAGHVRLRQPDGTTVVADDSAGPTNVYRHDGAGRLVALTDGHGHTLRKRYDEWGNPVEIVERGGGVTRQEFDDRGHLVRRTTPSGAVFTVALGRRRPGGRDHGRRRRTTPTPGSPTPAPSASRRRSSTRRAGSPGCT